MLSPSRRTFAAVFFVFLLFSLSLLCFGAEETPDQPDQLSPALYLIAEDLHLVKTGQMGVEVKFSPDDFDECLGVRKVAEVMITSLPPVTAGTLKLGEDTVLKNQVITRSRLDELRFLPMGSDECEAAFTFRAVGSEEYELTCQLYLLDGINYKPSVETIASSKTAITTYENIATFRRMSAIDPENDLLTFEIVEYPKKGLLTVTDRNLGSYVYTPIADFVGKDAFTFVAYDRYGNCSEQVEVEIQVVENEAAVVYSDLIGEPGQYPALRLTAEKITSVRYENGSAVFDPEESVTRLDFLVMAMQAAGYRVSTTASATPFADDVDIPAQAKGYVCAAVNLGFVNGVQTDNGLYFYPNASITRAEVAVILNRMIDLDQPTIRPVFSDSESIPTYAVEAMQALSSAGILESIGTAISPKVALNRAQNAEILCAVMDYLESNQ